MQSLAQTKRSYELGGKGTQTEKPESSHNPDLQSGISENLQMYHEILREEEAHRKREKTIVLMVSLILLMVGMTAAVLGQSTSQFRYSAEHGSEMLFIPTQRQPRPHIAGYGIAEAAELPFALDRAEEARREKAKIKAAQRRDEELRKKVTELASTSLKLYQRFSDPTVIHADTPELASRCEKLAKAIKRLVR